MISSLLSFLTPRRLAAAIVGAALLSGLTGCMVMTEPTTQGSTQPQSPKSSGGIVRTNDATRFAQRNTLNDFIVDSNGNRLYSEAQLADMVQPYAQAYLDKYRDQIMGIKAQNQGISLTTATCMHAFARIQLAVKPGSQEDNDPFRNINITKTGSLYPFLAIMAQVEPIAGVPVKNTQAMTTYVVNLPASQSFRVVEPELAAFARSAVAPRVMELNAAIGQTNIAPAASAVVIPQAPVAAPAAPAVAPQPAAINAPPAPASSHLGQQPAAPQPVASSIASMSASQLQQLQREAASQYFIAYSQQITAKIPDIRPDQVLGQMMSEIGLKPEDAPRLPKEAAAVVAAVHSVRYPGSVQVSYSNPAMALAMAKVGSSPKAIEYIKLMLAEAPAVPELAR